MPHSAGRGATAVVCSRHTLPGWFCSARLVCPCRRVASHVTDDERGWCGGSSWRHEWQFHWHVRGCVSHVVGLTSVEGNVLLRRTIPVPGRLYRTSGTIFITYRMVVVASTRKYCTVYIVACGGLVGLGVMSCPAGVGVQMSSWHRPHDDSLLLTMYTKLKSSTSVLYRIQLGSRR